jgi:8-oxo-dGTP diphosphatase
MIEVVAAVIVFQNRLLAFQRGDSKYSYVANKFEFPGGKVRKDEPRADSLIRELREELDLDIRVGEWITTVEHEYQDFSIRMHCYLVHLESFTGILKEHISFFHGSLDEARNLDWIEADKPILDILESRYCHVFA